jgi:hypothetical protein
LSSSAPAAYWSSFAAAADVLAILPDGAHAYLAPGRHQLDCAWNLDYCFNSISDAAGDDVSKVLPDSATDFWKVYEHSVPPKLQRAICSLIDQAFADMSRHDKQRVVSCQAKGSSSWLTVIPTSPDVSD